MIAPVRVRIDWKPAVLAIFVLSGCAGTRVNDSVSSRASGMPAPRTIAVVSEVRLGFPPRHESAATQAAAANQVNIVLNSELSATLREHRLTVVDASESSDLLLHTRIVDVRRGKKALRLLVGYGAGRAELQVDTSIELPHAPQARPLLSFQTKSTTGGMPGNLIGAAVKSLLEDGLDTEVKDTVKQIDAELGQYFVSQGWPYEAASSDGDATPPHTR